MCVIARSEATKQSRSRCTRPLDPRSRGAFFILPRALPRHLILRCSRVARAAKDAGPRNYIRKRYILRAAEPIYAA